MRKTSIIFSLIAILLMPVYASAQTSDRITILENFDSYSNGEPIFVFGQVAQIVDGSFLIMQITNPNGDLCQIQQLVPLPDGVFITDVIPLQGPICGVSGGYEIKLFYGDDSTTTTFDVSSNSFSEPSPEQKISLAENLISTHASIAGVSTNFSSLPSNQTTSNLSILESHYVDLWTESTVDALLVEVDPEIQLAVSSSLNSVKGLLDKDEISSDVFTSISKTIFASVFYYEIGDKTKAIDLLTDAFVDLRNINPEKITGQRTLTFDELEDTLLNLMKKSNTIMGKSVKTEIGFIFARGTASVYSDEINALIDMLSKARYLDVVSRQQSDLYTLIQGDWEILKLSLMEKESVEELLSFSLTVSDLHKTAILLRELDDVEDFVSSDSEESQDLVSLILPDWNKLENQLVLATSVDTILESESEINQMAMIITISSRISKSVEISQESGINSSLVDDWKLLLDRLENTKSVDEILTIISEFDQSMTELREKRNPLDVLEFDYNAMKEKAELQADYKNLFLINNAMKILDTAKQMESGNNSVTRIDRIEVLLTWISEMSPQIKSDLDSYDKDAFQIRASDILQRAKSLENLVELSLTKNRFLPHYVEFTETFAEKIDNVRDLVIQNDLDRADELVRSLFGEWSLVSQAYADDPHGSSVGYSVDEIKRIEFREKLATFSTMVSTFYNAEFSTHVDEYNKMMEDANELIEIANFVDAESKISEIGKYLSEHLAQNSPRIIYDISFDSEKDIWIITGATEKSLFDRRENLYVTVYNMDGSTHSNLKFTDSKQGNFFTQWIAPTEPGLYVVMLQYQNAKATQIVHVEDKFDYEYGESDLNLVDLARDFEELKSFAEKFGGENFNENPRFASVINEIKSAFAGRNTEVVDDNLDELKTLIERHLPVRSRAAVVEAIYEDDKLIVSGAVEKTIEFREDLFVDIYDQKGSLVDEIALKDNSSGLFTEVLSQSFDSGTYVVQLQYHDVSVTDFFNVR